jgi:hypothetical protein
MAVATFEGIVEAGQIRLLSGEQLPENTTVYIVVPDYKTEEEPTYKVTLPAKPRVMSPRLERKEDASHFALKVSEDAHAGI